MSVIRGSCCNPLGFISPCSSNSSITSRPRHRPAGHQFSIQTLQHVPTVLPQCLQHGNITASQQQQQQQQPVVTMKGFLSIISILVMLGCLHLQADSALTVEECQTQCYNQYRAYYNYYCGWGRLCGNITNYLQQFYLNCRNNCNNQALTTVITTTTTPRPPTVSSSCGRSPLGGRIVGGVKALACEFPWVVAVHVGSSLCGGSILDPDTVITAGHCVVTSSGVASPNTIRVSYGSSSQQNMRSVGVTRVVVHPKIVVAQYRYDVSILTLATPLVFDSCTQPICLPPAGANAMTTEGCQAAGWGALSFTAPYEQNDLQKVSLPIVPLSQCLAAYGSSQLVSDINVCAGDIKVGGIDACLGDSGGPLMCYQNGAYFLYGTVSYGKGCAEPGFPGVYANIANPEINAWIRSNL